MRAKDEAVREYVDWRAHGADPTEALLVGARLLLVLAGAEDSLWRQDGNWSRVSGFDDRSRLTAAVFPGLPVGGETPPIGLASGGDGLRIGSAEYREPPWSPGGGSLWDADAIGAWFAERALQAGLDFDGSFRARSVRRRFLGGHDVSFAAPQSAWLFAGGSTAMCSSSNPHVDPSPYCAAVLADGSVQLHCHLSDGVADQGDKSFPDSNLAVRALVEMAERLRLREFPLSAQALS